MYRGCGRVAALATLLTLFLPQSGGVHDWQGEAHTAALDFGPSRRLLSNLTTRIKDGESAPRGRYPYFVSLRTLGTFVHFCGGVLVEPDIVVTAAHCVDEQASTKSGVSEPIAVISPHGINDDEADGAEVISTVKTVVHEKWQPGQFLEGYDIAVLFLKRPSTHQPIQIAPSDVPSFGQKLTATGFGGMAGDKFSQTLRQASSLDFVPNKNCNRPDVYEGKIKDSMICALDLITGQDTCQGDSGGPLAIADKNGKAEFDRLVGLVSFGPKPCGTGSMPGVYTRVSFFADWIQEVKRNKDNPAPRPPPVAAPQTVPAPSNPPQQGNNSPSEPSPAYTGDKAKLAEEFQCPVGVPCENDKTIAVNGVETICKCFAWMTDGFCHPQGWELMEGPGDCNFVADK